MGLACRLVCDEKGRLTSGQISSSSKVTFCFLPCTCFILWNQCSALNTITLELSETLFHTPVCDIVALQSHFFTMFWVHLYFAMYGYMCQVSETLQYSKSIFPVSDVTVG